MKIAICSDIHDNQENLKKIIRWCKGENIAFLICCGDVCNADTLEFLSQNYPGKIYMCEGNMELFSTGEPEKFANITNFGRQGGVFELDGKKIGICHEPYLIEGLLARNTCDIVFHGHTHKPWDEMRGSTRILNPGNVAGTLHRATFASWNTESGEAELHLVERLS